MKRGKLLNSSVSSVISEMGHTDTLTVADAGLPIPDSTKRIDLAVKNGMPDFLCTLEVILEELCVEKALIAEEIKDSNPDMDRAIKKMLNDLYRKFSKVPEIEYISHKKLKELTTTTKAVVRTGECSPYANIILISGVTF